MMQTRDKGRLHQVLEPSAVWRDPDGDRVADAGMWAQFDRAGLVDRRGRLDADAMDTLAVLGRPGVEYFAIFVERGQHRAALVAGGAGETVVAFRKGENVELSSIREESPPSALMRQLPDMPPAPVASLNVRMNDMAAGRPASSSNAARDARVLARLGAQRLVGQGELYAGIRDHHGRYRVTDNPIRYHDLRSGRVLVVCSPGYLSVAPATKRLLLTHLIKAHETLADN